MSVKYKGKDAPRLKPVAGSPPGTKGALVWNTDYAYADPSGYSVNQTVRQAYPQALKTFTDLAGAAEEVSMTYRPGGYCTVTQRNRASGVDSKTGAAQRDPTATVSETWNIDGVDEEVTLWESDKVAALIDKLTGMPARPDITARDLRRAWISMAETWAAESNPKAEIAISDTETLEVKTLNEKELLYYFDQWSGGTGANKADVESVLGLLAAGVQSVSQTSYAITLAVQVHTLYSQTATLYAGVDKYWTASDIGSVGNGLPGWLTLPTITPGKWLKRAPTMRTRTRTSFEFELRWEQDRRPSTYLYGDYKTTP